MPFQLFGDVFFVLQISCENRYGLFFLMTGFQGEVLRKERTGSSEMPQKAEPSVLANSKKRTTSAFDGKFFSQLSNYRESLRIMLSER